MTVKVYERVREVPLAEVNVSGYCTTIQAMVETGLEKNVIHSHVHQTRLIASIQLGGARLINLSDARKLAADLKSGKLQRGSRRELVRRATKRQAVAA